MDRPTGALFSRMDWATRTKNFAQSRAVRAASSGVGASVFILVVATLNSILAARLLGASGKGMAAILGVVVSQVALTFGLSLENAVMHFGGNNEARALYISRLALKLSAPMIVASALISLLLGTILISNGQVSIPLALACASWSAQIVVGPIAAVDRLRGRHHRASWTPAWFSASPLIGSALAVGIEPTFEAYLYGISIGSMVAFSVLILSFPRAQGRPPTSFPGVTAKGIVTYSMSGHWGAVLHALNLRLPLIVLAAFASTVSVGIFSVALAIAETALVTSQGALSWTLAAAAQRPDDYRTLKRALKFVSLTTVAILIMVTAISPVILTPVFGTEFGQAAWQILLISPGMVALAGWRLAAYDSAVRGQPRLRTVSAAFGTLAGVIVSVPLCSTWGASGAAVAATIIYGAMFGSLFFRPGRLLEALFRT